MIRTSHSRAIAICMRAAVGDVQGLHGYLIGEREGGLLAALLRALVEQMPQLPFGAHSTITRTLIDLLSVAVSPFGSGARSEFYRLEHVRFETVRRFIEANIGVPDFSVQHITQATGISRAGLYRLFESSGGVNRFVQQCRLQQLRERLDNRVYRQTGIGHGVASPDGETTSAAVQAAWPLAAARWQITPAVGALYQHQTLDSFNEVVPSTSPLAPAFAVSGAHTTYNTMQPYAKVSFATAFVAQGISYVPQFEVGYRYDTRNGNTPVVQERAQDGTVFAMPGNNLGRGMATVGARITAQAGKSWNLYLDYQGQFSGRLSDNALSVGFTKQF